MEREKKGGRTRRGKSRIILDRSQGARRKLFRPPSSPHFSFPTRDGGKKGPFSTSFSLVLFFVGNHNNSFHYSLLRLGQIPLFPGALSSCFILDRVFRASNKASEILILVHVQSCHGGRCVLLLIESKYFLFFSACYDIYWKCSLCPSYFASSALKITE